MVYTEQLTNVMYSLALTKENKDILEEWVELKEKEGYTPAEIQKAMGSILATAVEVEVRFRKKKN